MRTITWRAIGLAAAGLASLSCHQAGSNAMARLVRPENVTLEILASAKTNGDFKPCG